MVRLVKLFFNKLWRKTDASSSTPKVLGLEPLHPEKGRLDNAIYVEELKDAITKESINNIALTGSYGSGKSSILYDFAHQVQPSRWPFRLLRKKRDKYRKKRVIQISLAALGGDYKTEGKPEQDEGKDGLEESSRIQKEIVKQLLFKEAPVKVSGSKFKRISKPYKTRIVLISILGAISTTAVIYLVWGSSILYPLAGLWSEQAFIAFSMSFFLFSLIALILFGLHGNFVVDKLTGGPVSLAVSKDNNYFDQYLDELIYFFEATDYDIVIFEDIERFDNAYIFVALKQLNSILNDAGQIKATGKQIRFIYAIKDSLFSKGEFAGYEQSTNRAKFFDLIISVVPFVTHQSSNDIMTDMFITKGKKEISKDSIAIVSKYITDMRLIKNIYNEYLIFEKKILGKDKLPGLTPDKLFAMIVYKNTNLKDFENIKLGKSKLEKVYSVYRCAISENVTRLNNRIVSLSEKIEDPQSIAARSKEYGDRLISYLQMTISALQAKNVSYHLPTGSYTLEQMRNGDFWENAGQLSPNDSLTVNYEVLRPRYGMVPGSMTFSRDKLQAIVGGSLDGGRLADEDIVKFKKELSQLRKHVKAMPYKTLQEILSLDNSSEFRKEIENLIGKKEGEDSLTYDLLEADHIDENFVLYTSTFLGANPRAANFLIHHLQKNKPDFHYKFRGERAERDDTDANIKELLAGSGKGYLRNRSIYNIEIVNYLLKTARQHSTDNASLALRHVIENLIQGESEDEAFLDEYVRSGDGAEKLIKSLSSKWTKVFDYLITRKEMSYPERIKLFNAAFEGVKEEVQYSTEEDILDFISENAQSMKVFTRPLEAKAALDIKSVLPQFNIKLTSFSRLHNDIKEVIIANNLYAINQKNLENATGLKDLSLDNILSVNEKVFSYIAANVEDYLLAITESKLTKYTINNNDTFSAIVDAIAEQGQMHLIDVLRDRSDDCSIEDLSKSVQAAWPALLDSQAVDPLSSNILAYYDQDDSGRIDQHLARYFENEGRIVVDNKDTEEDLQKLAVAILSEEQIAPRIRSKLIKDLELKDRIAIDAFPVQESELYGYLLEDGIIEDSASSYEHLKKATLNTRHFYIAKSHHFSEYVNEVVLNSDEINIIATASNIHPSVKRRTITNLALFDAELPSGAIKALSAFAVDDGMTLDLFTLNIMVDIADAITSIRLINQSEESFTKDGMIQMLESIGVEYARLAQKGTQVTLDDMEYNRQLVERLKRLGMVSSVTEKGGRKMKVNMKKKW